MDNKKMKYVAIKVKGLKDWLWFEKTRVLEENCRFIGKKGWGNDGALTEIDISEDEIVGRIESESLQY